MKLRKYPKIYFVVIAVILAFFIIFTISKVNEKETLYIYNWTYYTPQEIIDGFEQKYNVKVVIDNFSSNDEMFSKLLANKASGYDLVFPSADYAQIMSELDMLEPIDLSLIPNYKYVNQELKDKLSLSISPTQALPYFLGTFGVAVNTKYVNDYPRDFSIYKLPIAKNRSTMVDSQKDVLASALVALGYPSNSQDENQINQARDHVLKEIKPYILKFDSESFAKGFASEEFLIVTGYAESIFEELEDTSYIDFFIPPNAVSYVDMVAIPSKAKHRDLAHAFINYFYDPKVNAIFLDKFNFPSTVVDKAADYRTTTPFYDAKDALDKDIELNTGAALKFYNKAWQKIRYN